MFMPQGARASKTEITSHTPILHRLLQGWRKPTQGESALKMLTMHVSYLCPRIATPLLLLAAPPNVFDGKNMFIADTTFSCYSGRPCPWMALAGVVANTQVGTGAASYRLGRTTAEARILTQRNKTHA